MKRCAWAESHPLLIVYHDLEWGVPVHDDRHLFEMLLLEGAQAGLSWLTILKKRESYRRAFDGFYAPAMAHYNSRTIKTLMANDGIVRNRLKIAAAIDNARAYQRVRREWGSFDAYLWQFVGAASRRKSAVGAGSIPTTSSEGEAMSKDLRARGFRFVGPTICYAFMQATGMVNDHAPGCFRFKVCNALRCVDTRKAAR